MPPVTACVDSVLGRAALIELIVSNSDPRSSGTGQRTDRSGNDLRREVLPHSWDCW